MITAQTLRIQPKLKLRRRSSGLWSLRPLYWSSSSSLLDKRRKQQEGELPKEKEKEEEEKTQKFLLHESGETMATDLSEFTIIKEGEAEILMHAKNQVFFNKAQVPIFPIYHDFYLVFC